MSDSSTKCLHTVCFSFIFFHFFFLFFLPDGINHARKLNSTAAKHFLSWASDAAVAAPQTYRSHKSLVLDIQPLGARLARLASASQDRSQERSPPVEGRVPVFICWQPRLTAGTRCGFSKHMTSMITSMGALNRFKFCTCVARQQHNRSPSLHPYVALRWDFCATIIENG